MMTLDVISSSSEGNGYILRSNGEVLLIECGVREKDIFKALSVSDLGNIAGCLISHKHSDHMKPQTLKKLSMYGVDIFAPPSVCDIYNKCLPIEHMHKYEIGSFLIIPLRVPHGDCECYSYYIRTPNEHSMIFCTDAETFPYSISNVDTFLIECNYSVDIYANRTLRHGNSYASTKNHMELQEAISILQRHQSPILSNIILLHLSNGNSDEEMFRKAIYSKVGICPQIAVGGKRFELSFNDF